MKERVIAPNLYTERLVLSDISEENASVILKWRGNPEVYRYFVSPHKITLEEHLKWFNNIYIYDDNRYDWMAFCDGEPIGVFGVKRENTDPNIAEVSYILAPEHYGKGYAKEAVIRLISFCSNDWNCQKVIAEIHKDNTSSIRFIENLGFEIEAEDGTFIRYSKKL